MSTSDFVSVNEFAANVDEVTIHSNRRMTCGLGVEYADPDAFRNIQRFQWNFAFGHDC